MGEHRLGFAWLGGDRGQGVRHRGHPERALPYVHQPACCRRGGGQGGGDGHGGRHLGQSGKSVVQWDSWAGEPSLEPWAGEPSLETWARQGGQAEAVGQPWLEHLAQMWGPWAEEQSLETWARQGGQAEAVGQPWLEHLAQMWGQPFRHRGHPYVQDQACGWGCHGVRHRGHVRSLLEPRACHWHGQSRGNWFLASS